MCEIAGDLVFCIKKYVIVCDFMYFYMKSMRKDKRLTDNEILTYISLEWNRMLRKCFLCSILGISLFFFFSFYLPLNYIDDIDRIGMPIFRAFIKRYECLKDIF